MGARPPDGDWQLLEFGEVVSTNAEAMALAQQGQRGPLWVRADRQTGGRGRSGRSWLSGNGDLMASLLLTPRCDPGVLYQLSLVTGVAVWDAVARIVPPSLALGPGLADTNSLGSRLNGLRLKWPNDVLIGPEKLGGILVESSTFAGDTVAVVGIGVNLVNAPGLDGYAATALSRHTTAESAAVLIPPSQMLSAIAAAMEQRLRMWDKGAGFPEIRQAWLQRSGPVGEAMTINAGRQRVAGAFAGLDGDGALLLRTDDGRSERFTFGDVTLGGTAMPQAKA